MHDGTCPTSGPTSAGARRQRSVRGPPESSALLQLAVLGERRQIGHRDQEVQRGLTCEEWHLIESQSGISSSNELLSYLISLL